MGVLLWLLLLFDMDCTRPGGCKKGRLTAGLQVESDVGFLSDLVLDSCGTRGIVRPLQGAIHNALKYPAPSTPPAYPGADWIYV